MARALRVRLIEIKKELNQAKQRVVDELSALEYEPLTDESKLAKKNAELEVQNLRLKAQLNRAHLYGRLFSSDVIFRCIECFVRHDVIQNMLRTKSNVVGVIRYKCKHCGAALNSEGEP